MDQKELAVAAGKHEKTISRWENDRQIPDDDEELAPAAAALGVTIPWLRYGDNGDPTGERLIVRESPADRVPPIPRDLPKNVRVWLHEFLLELAEADVPDDQIDAVKRALLSPENFDLFVGQQPTSYTEDQILGGMRTFAMTIRDALRARGFDIKPPPARDALVELHEKPHPRAGKKPGRR